MGREIQKKKNRSSIPKLKHKPKSKKKLISNSIVAANWDKTKTLAQNYRRLGLSAKLNSASGGVEKSGDKGSERIATGAADTLRARTNAFEVKKGESETPFVYEVDIERDTESGKILYVLEDSGLPAAQKVRSARSDRRAHRGKDPLGDDRSLPLDVHATLGHLGSHPAGTSVVAALEDVAKRGERKSPRRQSTREEAWIERLIAAHGNDYSAMFKDRALNPMQQSAGDLRRRITKYSDSHKTG